ncbi:CSMD [Mytilus coruscus]|uniref:CSMD n=1 Tax=Mytilus coruscus TaxID=42192 RepID=A0A6J8AXV4_MYTCO|nr:CSMD [Mytilus coruscus]
MVTCQSDGTWSDQQLNCTGVPCPSLPKVDNALLPTKIQGYRYPETLKVSCETGYVFEGSNLLQCNSSGFWGFILQCKAVTCHGLRQMPHQKLEPVQIIYSYRDNVTFKCNDGYELSSGNTMVTCQSDGAWSDQQPNCAANGMEYTQLQSVGNIKSWSRRLFKLREKKCRYGSHLSFLETCDRLKIIPKEFNLKWTFILCKVDASHQENMNNIVEDSWYQLIKESIKKTRKKKNCQNEYSKFKKSSYFTPSPGRERWLDEYVQTIKDEVLSRLSRKFKTNITTEEEKAMRELLYDESIVIRPSDKSSGVVIMNTDKDLTQKNEN